MCFWEPRWLSTSEKYLILDPIGWFGQSNAIYMGEMVCIMFCKSQLPIIAIWPLWSCFQFCFYRMQQAMLPKHIFLSSVHWFASCWTGLPSSVWEDRNIKHFSLQVTSYAVVSWHILNSGFVSEKKATMYEWRELGAWFNLSSRLLFWFGLFDLDMSSVSAN